MTHHFGYVLIAIIFILLNAFFVAAEFAMVRLRRTQIVQLAKDSGLNGKILLSIHKRLDAYLSACQLGVTLASLGLGWVGKPAFAHLLEPLLKSFQLKHSSITIIAFTAAFSIISVLHIVIGELMPKSLAIRKTEAISILTAIPLYLFYWLMNPAIQILNLCSNSLLKLFRLNDSDNSANFYSTEEIKLILHSSYVHGELTKDEAEIMEHTLEFADLRITEIMRPSDELITIDINASLDDAIKIILSTRFSRYPVCDGERIVGFVHVKDIFASRYAERNDRKSFSLSKLIRRTINVQHNVPAIELLHQFRRIGTHFGLIYKNRELIGFVTLDNMLHVILGRIKDEFHKTEYDWETNVDGSITVSGDCTIYTLERALDIEIEDNEKYAIDSVTQLIIHRLDHLPAIGKVVDLNDFSFKITRFTKNEIEELIVYPKAPEEKHSFLY